jgi:hypothetical protein
MEITGLTTFIITILYTSYAYYWLYNYVVRVYDFSEDNKEVQAKYFQFFCMSIIVSVILFWYSFLGSYTIIVFLSFISLGLIYITLSQSKKLLKTKSEVEAEKMIKLFLTGDRETMISVIEKYKKMQDENGVFNVESPQYRKNQIFYFAVTKALSECNFSSSTQF